MKINTCKILTDCGWLVNGRHRVPDDTDNSDYQAIQQWIADGNTPADADPPPVPEPSWIGDRIAAYGSVGSQLDMQFWDGVNDTTVWPDHIAKVKSDYPKPEVPE